jgi:hypothetical protein
VDVLCVLFKVHVEMEYVSILESRLDRVANEAVLRVHGNEVIVYSSEVVDGVYVLSCEDICVEWKCRKKQAEDARR